MEYAMYKRNKINDIFVQENLKLRNLKVNEKTSGGTVISKIFIKCKK